MIHHHLFNVRIDDLDHDELDQQLSLWLLGHEQKMIVTPNSEFLVRARRDDEFLAMLNVSDLSLPDGIGVKYATAALDEVLQNRHTGVDTFLHLCWLCAEKGKKILLLGGDPGSAEQAVLIVKQKHPMIEAIGIDPGGLALNRVGEIEIPDDLIEKINALAPDAIAVALGAGKQEAFMVQHLAKWPSIKVAIGVGGTFETVAGVIPRAPTHWRSIGVEWLWRLCQEPRRFRRIITASIYWPLLVAWEARRQGRFIKACRNVFPTVARQITGSRARHTGSRDPVCQDQEDNNQL